VSAIEELWRSSPKLPGIGRKTAQRLTFHLLKATARSRGAVGRRHRRGPWESHGGACVRKPSDEDPCPICRDPRRDAALLCVVEEWATSVRSSAPAATAAAIMSSAAGSRLWMALGGRAALDRVAQRDLTNGSEVREVIVATNARWKGKATATYLQQILKPSRRARHAHRAGTAGGWRP